MRVVLMMQHINHAIRRWKPAFIKLLASPGIFFPITPIKHDIIQRDFSLAELFYRRQDLLLSFISLPTLPKSKRPFRNDRRFTGQGSVTGDYFVHIFSIDEI